MPYAINNRNSNNSEYFNSECSNYSDKHTNTTYKKNYTSNIGYTDFFGCN